MDKKLLPYFENVNDGGEQRKYLKNLEIKKRKKVFVYTYQLLGYIYGITAQIKLRIRYGKK